MYEVWLNLSSRGVRGELESIRIGGLQIMRSSNRVGALSITTTTFAADGLRAVMGVDHASGSDAEQLRILAEELDRLPRVEREAVELHHLAGHTVREIAAAVGSTHSTAMRRVQRGMAKLRDALQKRGVTLSLTALAGLLSLDAAEAPSPDLIDRLLASAPPAGVVNPFALLLTPAVVEDLDLPFGIN